MNEIDIAIAKPNRNSALRKRSGKFWCAGCDMVMVHPGQKCPLCNKRYSKRRLK